MNTVTEERNTAEAAICVLCTELVEAHNVANVLAHAAPTAAAAPAPVHTMEKIPFPDKFDRTRSKL